MLNRRLLASVFFAATILSISALPAFAQTAIIVSGFGTINRTATDGYYGTQQTPANQAGGLIEFQHLSGAFRGFEAAYSYNRANTTYSTYPPRSGGSTYLPPFGCFDPFGCSKATVGANAHELTADWTPSRLIFKQRMLLFGVLGAGLLAEVPSSSKATVVTNYPCGLPFSSGGGISIVCPGTPVTVITTSDTKAVFKPVYVYGAGIDWGLFSHLGMRIQYRGNFYSAPNMTKFFSPTGAYTHTAEPLVGIYWVL